MQDITYYWPETPEDLAFYEQYKNLITIPYSEVMEKRKKSLEQYLAKKEGNPYPFSGMKEERNTFPIIPCSKRNIESTVNL